MAKGIGVAPVVLHTGVASLEAHELPYPERMTLPEPTAEWVNSAHRSGHRVITVGTTVVRALETAGGPHGTVTAYDGWTDVVISPDNRVRVVDGMITGWHEPAPSHLLQAIAGRDLLRTSYDAALTQGFRWHEFGDTHLILPSPSIAWPARWLESGIALIRTSSRRSAGCKTSPMDVHLVDGTYELFRQYFGQPSRQADDGQEIGAVRGVLLSLVGMIEGGATHLGVATDHVVESFRNDLWPGYKTGEGIEPELRSQFGILETALEAMGVVVWPMVELEADDALASAASAAAEDPSVDRVIICTPDKDLAQCVVGGRVVQLDRRKGVVTDEDGVWAKFGVGPRSIPDWLALVGDSADGFPGLAGWGKRSASVVLAHYGTFDAVPDDVADWVPEVRNGLRGAATLAARLAEERERAELFRDLATLRRDPDLLDEVPSLEWRAPTEEFDEVCRLLRDAGLADRVRAAATG